MSLSPQERAEIDALKALVNSLVAVENVPFIKNIARRAGTGIESSGITTTATIVQAVSEAGIGSYQVAKVPDGKLKIRLADGTTKFIGVYNS